MTGLAVWIAKGVASAAYWLACLYVATGLFAGDRVTAEGIGAPPAPLPPWAFTLLTIALYAALSLAWDKLVGARRPR